MDKGTKGERDRGTRTTGHQDHSKSRNGAQGAESIALSAKTKTGRQVAASRSKCGMRNRRTGETENRGYGDKETNGQRDHGTTRPQDNRTISNREAPSA